ADCHHPRRPGHDLGPPWPIGLSARSSPSSPPWPLFSSSSLPRSGRRTSARTATGAPPTRSSRLSAPTTPTPADGRAPPAGHPRARAAPRRLPDALATARLPRPLDRHAGGERVVRRRPAAVDGVLRRPARRAPLGRPAPTPRRHRRTRLVLVLGPPGRVIGPAARPRPRRRRHRGHQRRPALRRRAHHPDPRGPPEERPQR